MRQLLPYLRHYKREVACAPLFKLLEAIFELIVPLVMARLIDVGIGTRDEGTVLRMGGLLALLAFVGLVAAITAQYFAARAAVGFASEVRMALFSKIQGFSFTQLDTIGTKALTTRLTSDVNQAQNGVNMVLRLLLRSPFIVFGAVIMAFAVDARAARVFVAVVPALSLIVWLVMRGTAPRYRAAQGKLDEVLLHTRENLTGARVIRAFHREREEREAFEDANRALVKIQRSAGAVSGLLGPATQLVVNAGIIVLILTGAVQVDAGTLTRGQVVALLNYMSQILIELVKFANLIVTISRSLASAGRIAAVLEVPVDMEDGEEPLPRGEAGKPAVVFDHVSFAYAGAGAEALHDISFTAAPGETIGIIGGTGAGKSSLVHLIPRFYDVTAGSVRIFGADARGLRLEELRGAVSVVFQRSDLFAGSIRDNLRFADVAADEARLRQALERSQAAEFVDSKPGGLDYELSQGGRNLSGGQRQRLAIARALTRRSRILILDDAGSALDQATNRRLRAAIRGLGASATVFVVSQRVPDVRSCDKILVLDRGRLAGLGTHAELLRDCEVYREICRSQFRDGEEGL